MHWVYPCLPTMLQHQSSIIIVWRVGRVYLVVTIVSLYIYVAGATCIYIIISTVMLRTWVLILCVYWHFQISPLSWLGGLAPLHHQKYIAWFHVVYSYVHVLCRQWCMDKSEPREEYNLFSLQWPAPSTGGIYQVLDLSYYFSGITLWDNGKMPRGLF